MALAALRDLASVDVLTHAPASSPRVGAMLPGHEEYARVLSPARDRFGTRITWRSLAGAELKPDVQWAALQVHSTPDLLEPAEGSIDAGTAASLITLLTPRTTTPDRCVFLVWDGYAGLSSVVSSSPIITTGFEGRPMHVLEGTIHDALESVQDDSFQRLPLWWLPLDGAWSVGGDLYGRSIYVGGDHATIQQLLNNPELETLHIDPDQELGAEDL